MTASCQLLPGSGRCVGAEHLLCARRRGPQVGEEEDEQEGPQVRQKLAWLRAAETVLLPEPDTNLLQQTELNAAGPGGGCGPQAACGREVRPRAKPLESASLVG